MRRPTPYVLALVALLAVAGLAAPSTPLHAQQPTEAPEQPPEVQPQPFPAEPEQPPAERRPDEVQPAEPAPEDPPADVEPYGSPTDPEDAEVGTEVEIEPPVVDDSGEQADETTDVLVGDADEAAWYREPLWVLVGLVALVVIVILLFSSGRRRS